MAEPLRDAFVTQTRTAMNMAATRLVGLSDEEFFWEPVPDCWSLRRKEDLRTPIEGETPGDWWQDYAVPEPDPAPFTTIAWLVTHMILGTWNWNDIIAGRKVAPEPELPPSAAEAVGLWIDVVKRFVTMVDGFDDADLLATVEAWDEQVPRTELVSHVTLEVLHHAAEVGRLRDLYRCMHT